MALRPLHSKRAQAISLVIVLAALAVMGVGAWFLSESLGAGVTGFVTLDYTLTSSNCSQTFTQSGVYGITSNVDCVATDGFRFDVGDVIFDCGGYTLSGDTGTGERGVIVYSDGDLSNISIQNCDIDGFDYGVYIWVTAIGGDHNISELQIINNTIENAGITGIRFRLASQTSYDAKITNTNITRNTFDTSDADFNITIDASSPGTETVSNVKIWLNNFEGGGIDNEYGTLDYCVDEEDSTIRNTFGNYYANSVPSGNKPQSKGIDGCSPSYLATIPQQFTGTLPTLCGSTVLGQLTLTENLINQTGSATCPTRALKVGSNSATIDCDGNNIRGVGPDVGIIASEGTYSGLTITDCDISNFVYGISWNGSGMRIEDSTIHGTSYGIKLSGDADTGNLFNITGNTIYNNTNYGIYLDHLEQGGEVSDNSIYNNSQGIRFYYTNSTYAMRNTFNNANTDISTGGALQLFAGYNNKIYLNTFLGVGPTTAFLSNNNFCYNNQGNFYKYTISSSRIAPSECGLVNITNPELSDLFYNVSTITVQWREQDSTNSITYYINIHNSTDWSQLATTTSTSYSWDVSDVFSNTQYNLSVTPLDTVENVNGTINSTGLFNISNDADEDGYSVLSSGSGDPNKYGDCNDQNASIHPPITRENDTTDAYVSDACYNTFDDDCDNDIDWLDDSCGHGFDAGSFNDSLYTNGSIDDLETSHVNGGAPNEYYVLIENEYGKIEYTSATNLTGVDLGDIFAITDNYVRGNPATVYGDRFNKSARVTFYNLTDYQKVPVVLVDGQPCGPEICSNYYPTQGPSNNDFSAFAYDLAFSSSHFSVFTTTNSSRLATFTQNDSEAAGVSSSFPKPIETYQRVKFYANYTRYPDAEPINNESTPNPNDDDVKHNGNCYISLMLPNGTAISGSQNRVMDYDSFYGVYYYESGVFNFTVPSDFYKYNISCNSTLYEPLALEETFKVTEDNTPPQEPILYPQILLQPTNVTDEHWTEVAGYFDESDINFTIMVLHGTWTYRFNGTTFYTDDHSEYKGEDIVVNFAATRGQNITFVDWNEEIERAFQQFKYMEFSNHNRTYFKRYYITKANRTGNDIRLETNASNGFEIDIPINTYISLYNAEYPSGYFRENVSLYSKSRKCSRGLDPCTLCRHSTDSADTMAIARSRKEHFRPGSNRFHQ
jgi:hypothetical protein